MLEPRKTKRKTTLQGRLSRAKSEGVLHNFVWAQSVRGCLAILLDSQPDMFMLDKEHDDGSLTDEGLLACAMAAFTTDTLMYIRVKKDEAVRVVAGQGIDNFPVFSCDRVLLEDLVVGTDQPSKDLEVLGGLVRAIVEFRRRLNRIGLVDRTIGLTDKRRLPEIQGKGFGVERPWIVFEFL